MWHEGGVEQLQVAPLIFDAMEARSKNSDFIRMFTGTPEYVKATMETRLEDA